MTYRRAPSQVPGILLPPLRYSGHLMSDITITEPEPWDDDAVLDWLEAQPGGSTQLRPAELGRLVGWSRQKVSRRLTAWVKDGQIVRRGRVITYNKARTRTRTIVKERVIREQVSAPDSRTNVPSETPDKPRTKRRTNGVSALAQAAVNATRTNATHPIENEQKKLGQIQSDLPTVEPDKKADTPPQIPPLTPHFDATSETPKMGLFSLFTRTKTKVPDTPAASYPVPAEAHETGVTEHQHGTIDGTFARHIDAPPVAKAHVVPGSGKGRPVHNEDDDDDIMPLDAMGWALIVGAVVLISFGAALAIVSAHVLYPGVPLPWFPEFAACMVAAMEVVRLLLIAAVTRWRKLAPWWALAAAWMIILFGESVSLIAVNAELHAMHQGNRPAVTAEATQGVTEANAQIDYWKSVVADIDRRIDLYDSNAGKIISADTKRGSAKSVQDAKKTTSDPKRAQLGEERRQAAAKLAAAQGDAGKATGKAAVIDTEAGVIRKTAALLHVSGDTAATYYIAATTMLVGPFAGVMVMFANSRRRRRAA
jgi:hypothetical protein